MKKHSVLISLVAVLNIGFCLAIENTETITIQTLEEKIRLGIERDSNYIYQTIEVQQSPEFPGGNDSLLYKFIAENLKYPNTEVDVVGRIICRFIVEKDGSISNVEVLKNLHPYFDKEVIRVVELMPKWIPAEKKGNKVRCYYTLPILFRIH